MDDKLIGEVLAGIAIGTAILCLLGGLTRKRWSAGNWAILLALAIAPMAADKPLPGLNKWPNWRSTDADQQVILAAVPLALLAAAFAGRRVVRWFRWIPAVVAPPAILYWILKAYPGSPLTDWQMRIALPSAVSLVMWLLIEPLALRRPTGVAAPWVCGCLTAGVGLLNLFSADTSPGWVAVALGGVIGGVFLFAFTGKGPSFAGGPVAVLLPLLVCLVMANRINDPTDVPTWQWLLLAGAPVLAWLPELKPMRNWKPWLREPLRMALVAIPIAIAVVPAAKRSLKEQSGGSDGAAGWGMVVPASATNGLAILR